MLALTRLLGLTLIDIILLFGVLVVAPLGLPLVERESSTIHRLAGSVYLPTALVAGGSFAVDEGWTAVALTAPLLAVAGALAIGGLPALWPVRSAVWRHLVPVASLAYLAGAAGWLAVSRLGARPLGLADEIVELTAAHFLFAGFRATGIGACVLSARERDGLPRNWLGEVAALGLPGGTALVAAGFAVLPVLQVVGATVLAVSLFVLAWLMFVAGRSRRFATGTRLLLIVAAGSVVIAMALALQYAFGQRFGTPALSIQSMVRTHGLLNGFGFTLGGLLGWRLAGVRGWRPSASS
jgi:energy-converting hydrogenase Eha subunit A